MREKLEKLVKNLDCFTEVRAVNGWSTKILIRDKEVESIDSGNSSAFSVRVLKNKSWGFASSNDFSKMRQTLKRAVSNARAASRKPINARLAPAKPIVDEVVSKPKIHPNDVSLEEKIKRCIELSKHAKMRGIVTTDAEYVEGYGESCYVNSDGASISFKPVSTLFAFAAYAKGEKLFRADERDAGLQGVEVLDNKESLVRKTSKNALLLTKSKLPPKGSFRVVVDPKMAGVFAHEAVGHACEADSVINDKSVMAGKIGKKIGSKHVTILDDPTLPKLFGSYPYDAEGVPGQPNVLIEKGVLKNFLHARETGSKLDTISTGNSRAGGVERFPLVRMSNTFFDKGSQSFEELVEPIRNGVYINGMKGGVTDPSSGYFQFAAEYGYLIKNGELKTPLRDITVVGNIMETLKLVEAAGNDWQVGQPGFCGKGGQMVPVSDGGPSLRIKKVLLSG